jgi:hypothetical protein
MSKVKVGDTISAILFGGKRIQGKVEHIEIGDKYNPKYGKSVQQCDTTKHPYGTLDLDNGHWCYFDQIKCLDL